MKFGKLIILIPLWLGAFFFCKQNALAEPIKEVMPQSQIEQTAMNYDVGAGLKYRLGIASFEDKTGYGDNLFGVIDDLGSQASDILAAHLVKSGRVIVVERSALDEVNEERELQGKASEDGLVWANALVLGSVTEFGTKTEYERGVFKKQKDQTAHAKVAIRLVDPNTGVAFFSEFGEAEATKSSKMKFGYGGAAGYDATIGDKALNGAVVKLVNNILNSLVNRPWEARIIDVQGETVFINAGKYSGLNVGDVLNVIQPGKQVKNPTTNAMIQLPGKTIGSIEIESFFGDSEVNEGAVCKVVDGAIPTLEHIVRAVKEEVQS